MEFMTHMFAGPVWVVVWVGWLVVVNTASLAFLKQKTARWITGAWLCNIVSMMIFFEIFGYERILGLSHVIWWTPLLIYVATRLKTRRDGAWKWYLPLLFVTNAASLVIDYIDVVRWCMGDIA